MARLTWRILATLILGLAFAGKASGQTITYHLHVEIDPATGLYLLKTNPADAPVSSLRSGDFKNTVPPFTDSITHVGHNVQTFFDAPTGMPAGTLPAGSTFSFSLWMMKTADYGTIYPAATIEYGSSFLQICTGTGSTALTTTLTQYTFSCASTSSITLSSATILYLVPQATLTASTNNRTVYAQLDFEGAPNGNYDSWIVVPQPPPPSITSLSPTSGAVGTSVTISGAHFGTTRGTSTVTFNGTAASPTSWSDTSIVAPVPTGATTGPVVVTTVAGASNGVTFTVGPSISTISPGLGASGTSVTISGLNFTGTPGTVTFNGTPVPTPTSWSATSIVAPVPTGATTGPVVVTVGGLASNGVTFTVAPSISSLSPASGAVGTSVTITGLNFTSTPGAVTFNGAAASPTSWSATSIVTPVAPGAIGGAGPVVVTVGGLASNSVTFTVTPGINNLTPSSGAIGTPVNINGTNFGTSTGTVTFNGVTATPLTSSWTNSYIVAPVPSGATTGPVVVTTAGAGGLASNSVTFTLTASISSLSPISGGVGTSVTISGSNFGATQGTTSTVAFNGIAATPTSWSATSIVAPVPTGASTGPVTVTVGGVTSNRITFTVAPAISSLSPASGPVGASVTISGSNFGITQGTNVVTFNGVFAYPTNWGNTSIVAPVPTGATTGPVVVTVNNVASNGVTFTVGTGTVTGTVTQASGGTAISGALVELLQSNVVRTSTNTAANGTYTVSNLAPGSYDLRFSAAGFGTAIQAGNNVTANGSTTVNAALSSAGTVSGQVTIAGGTTPISGASVTALQGTTTAGTATTNTTGNYSIATLSASSYTMQAAAPGYNPQSQTGVSVTAGTTTTTNFSLAGQALVSYVYDELGRLVGTVNSLGDAVTYNYDAVGNLLSIARNSAAQVSIIGFTPKSGPVGTSVTISGTAFSPTASQDTVSFNGTSATVTSATATQIVASVPTGATTGAITVTAPAGSATSSTSFTVTASTGPPTITGFTPTIATPSTAVTITGTNFDPAATKDRLEFNGTIAAVTSATATSISTSVPLAGTSGHISVATSSGKAVSSADLFVPPPPYKASDVDTNPNATVRISLPGSGQVQIQTANKIGLLIFDGTAGQLMSMQLTGSGFAGCGLSGNGVNVAVINPDSTTLESANCIGPSAFFDTVRLPLTGTYTLLVAPQSGFTGTMSVQLYSFVDVTSTITINGPTVTLPTQGSTYPGQNAYLTFGGNAGQPATVLLTNASFGGCAFGSSGVVVTIFNPDGSTLASSGCFFGNYTFSGLTLPTTGIYTIKIDPQVAATGSITAQVTSP